MVDKPTRLLRLAAVMERTGESRSGIYDKMASDQFPKSVPIGPRAVAWIEAEIDEHIADCIARRDKKHRVPPRSDSN